jgi:sugar lactone lactonase YvrE
MADPDFPIFSFDKHFNKVFQPQRGASTKSAREPSASASKNAYRVRTHRHPLLSFPTALAVDRSTGDVIIADSGSSTVLRLRPGDADTKLVIVAGEQFRPGAGARNCELRKARFQGLEGICCDSTGSVFVAEEQTADVRCIDLRRQRVEVVCSLGCTATAAVKAVCIDAFGTLYFTDTHDRCIYRVTAGGPLKVRRLSGFVVNHEISLLASAGRLLAASSALETACACAAGLPHRSELIRLALRP